MFEFWISILGCYIVEFVSNIILFSFQFSNQFRIFLFIFSIVPQKILKFYENLLPLAFNIYKNAFLTLLSWQRSCLQFLRLFYLNKRIKSRRYKRYTLNYFNVKIITGGVGERASENEGVEKLNKKKGEEILCEKLYDYL